jgi:hypothetical protein
MHLALLSVAIGSALTLGQIFILFNVLNIENYVYSRAVLNTMNIAAPFLCLGFDSAAPVLKRINQGYPFFWNIIVANFCALLIFILLSLILPVHSKLSPLLLGLAASTSVAGALIIANYYRVEGDFQRYFIGLNIIDKLVRTFIIVVLAVLVNDIFHWAILLSMCGSAYMCLIALKTKQPIRLNLSIFIKHMYIGLPYIFSSLGIIFMTRMPFYASYIFEDQLITAKLDIALLFSLFLLIPVLNKSKVEESISEGFVDKYLMGMKQSWHGIWFQELLVCFGIILMAIVSVLLDKATPHDILTILLPLMIGMILISSIPNFSQVLCLLGKFSQGIMASFFVAFVSIVIYLPLLLLPSVPVPCMFIVSASTYCIVGCIVLRKLDVEMHNFWRWKHALISIFICCIVLLLSCVILMA